MRVMFILFADNANSSDETCVVIDDFPCRLFNDDMIWEDNIFDKDILDKLDGDHPEVSCTCFDKDEKGIFQRVWLK